MSTYKELFGKYVQSLAADPTNAEAEGQIWYNTTSNTFKTILSSGAWSSGGALTNKRRNPAQGVGPSTASMSIGGMDGSTALAFNEQYNGTSWSEGSGALNTARQSMGGTTAGSQTAALVFGGTSSEPSTAGMTAATESYDGSAFSTSPYSMVTARYNLGGCGTQGAALGFGGYRPGAQQSESEEWNGSGWVEGNNMLTGRLGMGTCGTQTAALACNGYVDTGGSPTGVKDLTEEYDGTSWTSSGTNLVATYGNGAAGTQTSAISFGGSPDITTTTGYDGTTWSARSSLATGRDFVGMSGSATGALCVGGNAPSDAGLTTVEEWDVSTTVVVPAAWSSGGNLNAPRDSLSTAAQATQNAAFVFGGHNNSGSMTSSESYNGTAWAVTNALPVAKQLAGGAGTQGAALCFSGNTTGVVATTESWDGSNWTAVAAPGGTVGTGRINAGSAGIQGAALLFGGGPPTTASSEEWDGSNWAAGGSLTRGTTGADNICGAGIQTSALAMGGTAPSFVYNTTEEYNGTSWSGGGGLNTARRRAAAAASTVDSGLCFGGLASPGSGQTAASELYDGTSWTNTASMGTARYYLGGSGATQGDGFAMGGLLTGAASSFTDKTEEFTAPGTALNYKTLTTS